jgi:hypothetical protein
VCGKVRNLSSCSVSGVAPRAREPVESRPRVAMLEVRRVGVSLVGKALRARGATPDTERPTAGSAGRLRDS